MARCKDPQILKARRRIRRFLETGEQQARVSKTPTGFFIYKVKHHPLQRLLFRLDTRNRLYLVKNSVVMG